MDHGPPSNRRPWTMVFFEKRWWTMVWWTMVFSWTTVWWTMVLVDDGFGERWFAAFKIIKNIKDFQESVHEFSKIFACGGQLSGGLFFILCTGSSLVTFEIDYQPRGPPNHRPPNRRPPKYVGVPRKFET